MFYLSPPCLNGDARQSSYLGARVPICRLLLSRREPQKPPDPHSHLVLDPGTCLRYSSHSHHTGEDNLGAPLRSAPPRTPAPDPAAAGPSATVAAAVVVIAVIVTIVESVFFFFFATVATAAATPMMRFTKGDSMDCFHFAPRIPESRLATSYVCTSKFEAVALSWEGLNGRSAPAQTRGFLLGSHDAVLVTAALGTSWAESGRGPRERDREGQVSNGRKQERGIFRNPGRLPRASSTKREQMT